MFVGCIDEQTVDGGE